MPGLYFAICFTVSHLIKQASMLRPQLSWSDKCWFMPNLPVECNLTSRFLCPAPATGWKLVCFVLHFSQFKFLFTSFNLVLHFTAWLRMRTTGCLLAIRTRSWPIKALSSCHLIALEVINLSNLPACVYHCFFVLWSVRNISSNNVFSLAPRSWMWRFERRDVHGPLHERRPARQNQRAFPLRGQSIWYLLFKFWLTNPFLLGTSWSGTAHANQIGLCTGEFSFN